MSDLHEPAEVGALFGHSREYVMEKARTRQWPHLRVGRRVRFTDAHIEAIKKASERPVDPAKAAANSWGQKTRGGAA